MSDQRWGSRWHQGFGLVEVIVALVVLAIGVLGLAALTGLFASGARSSYLLTRVDGRARAQMERLLATGYQRLTSGERREGSVLIRWRVDGRNPKRLFLVAERAIGPDVLMDTLETLVRAP